MYNIKEKDKPKNCENEQNLVKKEEKKEKIVNLLIDENIYKFLYILIKSIFFKIDKYKIDSNIAKIITRIKNNYKIKIDCENKKEMLKNILKFVKKQNKLYAAEILENILITVFSFAFKDNPVIPHKYNTIGKYVHKNLLFLKGNSNLEEWFDYQKLNLDHLKIIYKKNYFSELINNDILFDEQSKKYNIFASDVQKEIILYDFLYELKKEKVSVLKLKKNSKQKFINYLNGEIKTIFNDINNDNSVKFENSTLTKNSQIVSAQYIPNDEINNKAPLRLAKSFLISVYIYYQNKHSPLMEFLKKKEDLSIKPFEYDLKGATIEFEYAGIVIPPARVESRISKINLTQNRLKEKGFLELAKLLIFNKKIKDIEFTRSSIKSYYLHYLSEGLGMFDNYSIENLDLSINYLKNDSELFLCNILSHLKGLKTINLSMNKLEDGIASFLIVLKKLYRQKKINLENLILNYCQLDEISFYELGELLKSKYCKLKNLYLFSSNITINSKFLKKLKKNKSLTEIYFNSSNLGKINTDDIMRVISNTQIENISLYKNRFFDFDDCLRILYRTKLILNEEEEKHKEKIIHDDSFLYNLDFSLNDFLSKNKTQIELLKTILENTTLYSRDLSRILFGKDPNEIFSKILKKISEHINNRNDLTEYQNSINELNEYQKSVFDLKIILDNKQREYKLNMREIFNYNVDKEEYLKKLEKKEEYSEYIEYFEKLNNKISDIIKDKNSIYPLFLIKRAKELIDRNENIFNNRELNFKETKKIEEKLVNYMIYKRALENLEILEKKVEKNKLILI